MKKLVLFSFLGFFAFMIFNYNNIVIEHKLPDIDYIIIHKDQRTLSVFHKGQCLKSYSIALGFCPVGPKEKEGDGKTPEGIYYISHKNPKSRYYLSLKISYPALKDVENARLKGYLPGGDIMIHGLRREFSWLGKKHTFRDWTLGCIALTNTEIAEIYPSIRVGTRVEIKK